MLILAYQEAECTSIEDSQILLNDKLANYTKQLRPLYNQSKALDVYLSFDLVSIRDFDEREGKFTVTGVLKCYWFDEMFTWNPDDYGGVDNVQIGVSTIWIPSMALVNPTEEMKRVSEDWHILHVENTGLIANLAGGIFSASCQIDVTYYPWDKQYCELWFMAWGYTHQQINLIQLSNHSTFYIYSEHGMWTVRDSQTGTFPEASLASFGFHVERKPLFVVINILSPIIFLSFMYERAVIHDSNRKWRKDLLLHHCSSGHCCVSYTCWGQPTKDVKSNVNIKLLSVVSTHSECMYNVTQHFEFKVVPCRR